jgi:hypothetical protein
METILGAKNECGDLSRRARSARVKRNCTCECSESVAGRFPTHTECKYHAFVETNGQMRRTDVIQRSQSVRDILPSHILQVLLHLSTGLVVGRPVTVNSISCLQG